MLSRFRTSLSLWNKPPVCGAHRTLSTNSNPKHNQTYELPDGRVLGYAEYGSPSGIPLFFFHGFPASRLEASGLERFAQRRKLRVISIDRPGFGLSTFQPNRRITDWPSDVKAMAGHLGLSRFGILGGSGGGPFAVACAHSLPHDMLSAVGLLAPSAPWEAGTKNVLWSSWLAYLMATYWPSGFKFLMNSTVDVARWAVSTKPIIQRLDAWLEDVKKKNQDGDEKTVEESRNELLQIVFDGFAQGSDGAVREAQLLTQDWGFKLSEVKYNRILIWHGTKDVNSPIDMVRYLADKLPYCELREFEDTHFTIADHLDQILDEFILEINVEGKNGNQTLSKAASNGGEGHATNSAGID